MRKIFNLEYYLAHPDTKVVTRCGNSARILCTDLKSPYPIVLAITLFDGKERIHITSEKLMAADVELDNELFFDLPDCEGDYYFVDDKEGGEE